MPANIIDPEENGVFKAGSNGTGPFKMTEMTVYRSATYVANPDWYRDGPYVDEVQLIDVGDDAVAIFGAYILSLTGRFAGDRGPVLVAVRSPKSGFSGHGPLCYVRTD